ncbi:MAG: 16S rRNA (guanine(966)-N(2))-methyltransferase RsmD [Motiliproteus sp.]|nr:16S rRNA (guanine(966)-N(2))-methyltransferase RsmD [Motiliproteus sp.]MCW9054213.1 16S rRNA (guanine(966)-N(2))-methyltransferase RsmD [Motiliproteus sp.]
MARKQQRRPVTSNRAGNTLRIIAGQWRGRKLPFPDQPGLRPTPDRVRETLFNWLQMHVPGSRCLDLFTGSGALALEALSRGAAKATLIDSSKAVIEQLGSNLRTLSAENVELVHNSALNWLQQPQTQNHYDLVFLDPPFRQQMLEPCCQLLENSGLLSSNGLIYIEAERELTPLPTPASWTLLKQKQSGQVISYLFQRSVESQ